MALSSKEYWEKREKEHMDQQIKDEEKLKKEVDKRYRKAYRAIQEDIDAFYGRYADKEGISITEARKRVKAFDVESFADKAKEYVKNKDFSSEANERLRLYNLTMKVNRLELLKADIGLELVDLFDGLDKFIEESLSKATLDELERQAGILGESVDDNQKIIKEIVNGSFQSATAENATFSQHLWAEMDTLKNELDSILVKGLTIGKNPRDLAREISKHLLTIDGKANSVYNVNRIMITEMARVQGAAQEASYKLYDFKEYIYIAEPSACDECTKLDGKIFKVKDMKVGTNMFPMHPFCKCSTAAYFDREAWDADLRRRGL